MIDQSLVTSRAVGSEQYQRADEATVISERVDALPLVLGHLQRMDLPVLIDVHAAGRQKGSELSLGQTATIWLAALLTQADYRPGTLSIWAQQRCETLQRSLQRPLHPHHLRNERLWEVLNALAIDPRWAALEAALDQRLLDQYGLPKAPDHLLTHALMQAQSARMQLQERLSRAREEIEALNHRRRGKFTVLSDLQHAAETLIEQYEVKEFIRVSYQERVFERLVRRYRGRPSSMRVEREIRVTSEVDTTALANASWRLGWWVYASTVSASALSVTHTLLAYRSAYLIERGCDLLARAFDLSEPRELRLDGHATGLIRLLSMGVRAFALLEHLIRPHLPALHRNGAGLEPAPAAIGEWLLGNFRDITLTIVREPHQDRYYLTPLSALQQQSLALLDLPEQLYARLTADNLIRW